MTLSRSEHFSVLVCGPRKGKTSGLGPAGARLSDAKPASWERLSGRVAPTRGYGGQSEGPRP